MERILPYIKAGYGVLLLAYRGYSGNQGQPSEQGLYNDARAALHFLKKQHIAEHCMVLFGESLGTGVAVQMATEFHVGAVILQSPYTSIADVGQKHYPFLPVHWLLKDRYDSRDKITHIHAPLFIFHGTKDKIIPLAMGEKIYQSALPPKQMKIYPEAGHGNLPNTSSLIMHFLQEHHVCTSK